MAARAAGPATPRPAARAARRWVCRHAWPLYASGSLQHHNAAANRGGRRCRGLPDGGRGDAQPDAAAGALPPPPSPSPSALHEALDARWGPAQFTVLVVQMLCLMIVSSNSALPLLSAALDVPAADLPATATAAALVCAELLQLWLITKLVNYSRGSGPPLTPASSPPVPVQAPPAQATTASPPSPVALRRYRLSAVAVAQGVGAGLACFGVTFACLQLAQGSSPAENTQAFSALQRATSGGLGTALLFASAVVLGPTLEEFVFRGVVLTGLSQWVNVHAANLVSAGLFAAVHLSAADFVPLLLIGATLGLSAIYSGGNLLVPTVAHATYNGLVAAAQALPPPLLSAAG